MTPTTDGICSSLDFRCVLAICKGTSFIALALTFLYVCLNRGTVKRANLLHIQLLGSNMAKYFFRIMMIVFHDKYMESMDKNGWICHGINLALTYTTITTFAWTANLAIEIFACLKPHDFKPSELSYVYFGVAWGAPLIPVLLGVFFAESLGDNRVCWEGLIGKYSARLIAAMVGLFIPNTIGQYIHLLALMWRSGSVRRSNKIITIVVTLVGTLPAILDLHIKFAYIENYVSMDWISDITTATQGIFMGIFYWVLYGPVNLKQRWCYLLLNDEQRHRDTIERKKTPKSA